jgi:hypothetical protein
MYIDIVNMGTVEGSWEAYLEAGPESLRKERRAKGCFKNGT